ncbi:MAG: hypothetical protein LIO77_03140 [Rikenellaceae bacterium]|nr:hypothetical protein [Rikenellaceae bacterium]
MFTISYRLHECLTFPEREAAGLDSADFRHRLFRGGFTLSDSLHRIVPRRNDVPLLDLSLCLLDIQHNLRDGARREDNYEFPLSDEMISFVRHGDRIDMEPTFDDIILTADFTEFSQQVRLFNKTLIAELIELNPSLYRNKLFLTYTNLVTLI